MNVQNDESWGELGLDDTAIQSLLDNPLQEPDTSRLRDGTQHEGFDNNMGESWIYPNNLPCRSYQMSIVQAALYRNTLVVLPTGLGKTFIAAVVMYNFYRWYPRGKIIFMAPTRPLVNQQIEACQKLMPFPKKDTVELTGKLERSKRGGIWKTKRVIFATPQVVQSDILGGRQQGVDGENENIQEANKTDFPFDHVKLIVIDEAHKAKGKYAYTEVTQALARNTKYFRVLALSATPGRTMEDVAEVCRNLLISHLEVRWETSIDVLPYVHKRTMDTIVVSMGDKITKIREDLLVIVDPYLRQLTEAQVLSGSLANINRNFLLYEQKRYRDRSFHMGRHPQHSAITSNFAICISIYHALELLERHGLRVFLNNFEEDVDGKNKFILKMDPRLYNLVENLKKDMGPNPFEFSAAPMTNGKIAEIPKDLDFGHPKFEKTRECLLKHFQANTESRAIVFCEYRESVMLIYRMLLQHVPLLNPRCFVGQGGTGSLRALTQKQQMQIMTDFRSGKSNILIATSIGEEGIDVGEVELIICFDISTSNPMRFVQRIGRTGRKKNGHVIMMVTEGREEQLLREVLSNKDQINKKLLRSNVVQQSLYKHAPRLVPTEFKPKCIQTFVKPPSDDEEMTTIKSKKSTVKKKATPKKAAPDLRKFFQKNPRELDKEDLEFFENDTNSTQAKPGPQTQQKIVNKLDKIKNLFKDLQTPTASQSQRSTKNSQGKVSNSQGSIKNFFKDSSTRNKNPNCLNKILNGTQENCNHIATETIDLCDNDNNKNPFDIVVEKSPTKKITPERMSKIKELLKKSITKRDVVKRSEENDLGYHLKTKQLSRQMKTLLLTIRPEYIKENLEQMQVLNTLHDNETANYTEDEKSIREINNIIIDLFGGLEKVEKFIDELEFEKYKQECLDSESESEEEDPQEMNNFQKQLDSILKGYGDGKRHDNYDWMQNRFKETSYYKDKIKTEMQSNVQESMIYENFAVPEEENTFNSFEEFSMTESKYCSQWQEFNKPDIAFKSTPIQPFKTLKRDHTLKKKNTTLSKHEETQEEHVIDQVNNDTPNTSTASKQLQNMLVTLQTSLKESSLNAIKSPVPQNEFNVFKTKPTANEMPALQATNHFEDFNLPDEDDLIMAATEAELNFTKNQCKEDNNDITGSIQLANKTPEMPSSTDNKQFSGENLNSHSLNSTPDINISSSHSKTSENASSSFKTPADLRLQQELDIDMEAFMDPFPEEEELIKNSQSYGGRENLKESLCTTASAIVRESPDIFAEEHARSAIIKPIACKGPSSLASKLFNNVKLVKCQSSLNPPTSPHKPLFSTQNPKDILITSPSTRLSTDKQKYERSPSLFDMYLKNTKGKGKLPKSLSNSSTLTSCIKMPNNACSPSIPASQQNESVIVMKKRKDVVAKRKIFDSDSEHEPQQNSVNTTNSKAANSDDSDFEEVAATQRPNDRSIFHHRRKRRRFNSFIEKEAHVSGSDHTEDEDEHTIGHYINDSVVVSSDEDDPDQASTSHMQAMYLRSIKSPQKRRGTFKIPAPRVYNDRSHIFSQAVLCEDIYSQYVPDSFVVEEDSTITDNAEISMCPLERAEKILKERRRAKKMGLSEEDCNKRTFNSKRKIHVIEESSEDDDFE